MVLIIYTVQFSARAADGAANLLPADDPLLAKYDLNHNGKIDAEEHRETVVPYNPSNRRDNRIHDRGLYCRGRQSRLE